MSKQVPSSAAVVTPGTDPIRTNSAGAVIPCSLYIGTSGDVNVITSAGETVLFQNHPVGYMAIEVTHCLATSTTASDIVALFP